MKLKFLTFALLAFTMFMSCSKVPAGNVGVKFYLLGGSKGVDSEELSPGRYWIGINEELYLFPTFTQNYVWTKSRDEGSENDESITFQTKEGLTVGADVGITYRIKPDKVSNIFSKYKKGINEITDVFLRNMVRDAFVSVASTKEVESVYGTGKNVMLKEVEDLIISRVDSIGIIIEKIYLIGEMRLPKQVTDALNAKIRATQVAQQKENELREAQAEAKKKIATAEGEAQSILMVAKAQAKANKLISASLTRNLVDYKGIEKWDGKLPTVSGQNTPFISLK